MRLVANSRVQYQATEKKNQNKTKQKKDKQKNKQKNTKNETPALILPSNGGTVICYYNTRCRQWWQNYKTDDPRVQRIKTASSGMTNS